MTRALALAAALLAIGCDQDLVGRRCFLGGDAGNDQQAIVASPSLDCESRTCLHVPKDEGVEPPDGARYADMCTVECSSDDDCVKVEGSPCVSGFTCAVPVVVGRFCCTKMCVCRDYLIVPDGGLPEPEACDPDQPQNTCCNLAGRGDRPECQ